jgi:hypothetical protein
VRVPHANEVHHAYSTNSQNKTRRPHNSLDSQPHYTCKGLKLSLNTTQFARKNQAAYLSNTPHIIDIYACISHAFDEAPGVQPHGAQHAQTFNTVAAHTASSCSSTAVGSNCLTGTWVIMLAGDTLAIASSEAGPYTGRPGQNVPIEAMEGGSTQAVRCTFKEAERQQSAAL